MREIFITSIVDFFKFVNQFDITIEIPVSNSMKPQRKAVIPGLLPATEYHIQVEGHNTAGYSAGDFYFFTLTKNGGKEDQPFVFLSFLSKI